MTYEAWDGTSETYHRLDQVFEPHVDAMTKKVVLASAELAYQGGFLANLMFGLGTHGAVDLDGVNEYDFATLDAGVYTLDDNVFATSLTIRQGIVLLRSNLQVHVNGAYVCDGIDDNSGRDAVDDNSAHGPGYGSSIIYYDVASNSAAGVTGGDGQGGFHSGTAAAGGASGVGGDSASFVGGAASPEPTNPFPQTFPAVTSNVQSSPYSGYLACGAYGGSGAGEDGQSGAGGGAPGLLFIAARSIGGRGTLRSKGGNGGNALAASNSGGGAGAGGGALILIGQLASTLTLNVDPGQGGLGDGTGSPGTAGTAGRILRF